MSKQISIITNVNIGENTTTVQKSFACDSATENSPDETAPVAKVGALSTRTSHTAGVFTKTAHGILDTATIAVFWNGGYRVNVDIDSVTDNTITFSGGTGDNLPAESGAVSVSKMLQVDVPFVGDNLAAICIKGSQDIIASIIDDSGSILDADLDANDAYLWSIGSGVNPVAGDTAIAVNFYNKSLVAADVSVIYGVNNTLDQV